MGSKKGSESLNPGAWRWKLVACLLLAILGLLLGYRHVYSPDIGYHMGVGRFILEEGQFPRQDTFSYSFYGNPVPYWPALFGLSTYLTYQWAGTLGLIILKMILVYISLALVLKRAALQLGSVTWPAAFMLLIFILGTYWEVRPHLYSWVFLNLTLFLLERYKTRPDRWIWLLPLIQAFWVNSHSLYILGIACIGIHGLADLILRKKIDLQLFKVGVAAWAACLLSPYTLSGFLYPLTQFGMLQPESVVQSAQSGTAEFLSPFRWEVFTQFGEFVWYQEDVFRMLTFAIVTMLCVAGWRRMRLVDWLLLLAFSYLYFRATKIYGYYFFVTLPMSARCASYLFEQLLKRGKSSPTRFLHKWSEGILFTTLAAAVVVVCVHVFNGYYYSERRSPHQLGHDFNGRVMPVRSCDYINEYLPESIRILNNWDTGGYLGFSTRRKVFIDGRTEILGEDFYREYLKTKDYQRLPAQLKKWNQNVALIPNNSIPQWLHYFHNSSDWEVVYQDPYHSVAIRKDLLESVSPPVVRNFPQYNPELPASEADLRARLSRNKSPGLIQSLVGPHDDSHQELAIVANSLLRGNPLEGLKAGWAGLDKATMYSPDLIINLGHCYYDLNQHDLALACFNHVNKDRLDPLARQRLRQLERGR